MGAASRPVSYKIAMAHPVILVRIYSTLASEYAVYPDLTFALPHRLTTTLVNRSCGMKGGHLTKWENRTPRAIRMAPSGQQRPFPRAWPNGPCSVQLKYTLA